MQVKLPLQEALAELDRALAAQPHVDGHRFSMIVQHLCDARDWLTARPPKDAWRTRWLEHLNAVITVVLAGHFPLGAVPWDELHKARDWLSQMVAESGPGL